ncbi:alternative ribosome rescue aminoacyl-tRNA hydrolase ArfB [Leptolyngbya sp. PCC 6406]|uniref:alternative ribosome rescue aminoacyl-tRNA hydrolase ArfB n=1 Tax=Leptolyngbya sp. PCC 6406 TaxID=1173264 RepID=UPI0002ACB813|nr:alternative ribosome rescue aminoacyl-tRNA hydrolase ArfB [Leptolyngbya sp. PCC 6406]
MLKITDHTAIPLGEIELSAVRSQGAGGQNVNKVATAIHLRFDIHASSLSPLYKERLLNLGDRRITKDGVIIIKAQQHRTQEQNREDALRRLQDLIQSVTVTPKARKPTKLSRTAQKKRLDRKTRRGQIKALRGNIQQEL